MTWMLNGPTHKFLDEWYVNPRCRSACSKASRVMALSYQSVVKHETVFLSYGGRVVHQSFDA